MRRQLATMIWCLLTASWAMGQTADPAGVTGTGRAGREGAGDAAAPARPKLSEGARAALAAARALENSLKGLDGDARLAALQSAAAAYDKVAADFAGEPPAAATAAFAAAGLWRRHGSPVEAEAGYLLAARHDPERYAQRGRIGAADMQRQQDRDAEALAGYVEAVAIDPATSQAQTARVWQGRLLQRLDRLDEAIGAFRAAQAAAHTPRQHIEAGNYLARALVAKGDLTAAESVLAAVDAAVAAAANSEPEEGERLRKAAASMSSRRALQRARDKRDHAVGDAQALEAAQRSGR